MDDLDAIVRDFLVESHENLGRLDVDLVQLEKSPHDRERLANIFRTIHTIKGTCGFLGYEKLGAVTHAGESLLSRLRDGKLTLTPPIIDALLKLVDVVRGLLSQIEASGCEGGGEYGDLIDTLTRLQELPPAGPEATPTPAAPVPLPPAEEAEDLALPATFKSGVSAGTIRVDVDLLDRLMTLVGELVLARNQLLQFTAAQRDSTLSRTSQRLNSITTELQEGVMKTRMQPIGNLWKALPRVVRDLAVLCGKLVELHAEGDETELDKSIMEAIKDPLTHLLRNAVDHGIEPPEERAAAGKPAAGRLTLRAFHEGGQVHIEIGDDGGGIDPERIKQKALERGLLTPAQAGRLSEQELLHLIFLPGFSTAAKVTSVSGRGVGMDVVKTNIEKIGGTVELSGRPGQGTLVRIKIPLTLAIIPALLVQAGGDRYAIPQINLVELIRLKGGIEFIHGTPVYRLRAAALAAGQPGPRTGRRVAADAARRTGRGRGGSPGRAADVWPGR